MDAILSGEDKARLILALNKLYETVKASPGADILPKVSAKFPDLHNDLLGFEKAWKEPYKRLKHVIQLEASPVRAPVAQTDVPFGTTFTKCTGQFHAKSMYATAMGSTPLQPQAATSQGERSFDQWDKKGGKDGKNKELEKINKELQKKVAELESRLAAFEAGAKKKKDVLPMSREQHKAMLLGSLDADEQAKAMDMLQQQARKEMEMQALQSENEKHREEISELKTNLARLLSKQMSADERNIENINESCRPSVISKEYQAFCSKQWLKAKEALDAMPHKLDERSKCMFLARILEVASQSAVACVEVMLEGLRVSPGEEPNIVDTVICTKLAEGRAMAQKQKILDGEKRRLTEDVRIAVTKYLKIFADDVHTTRWTQEVVRRVMADLNLNDPSLMSDLYRDNRVNKYLVGACKLSWRMAVQLPPMTLTCGLTSREPLPDVTTSRVSMEQPYDATSHELAMSSPPPREGSVVDYFVTPILMHEPHVMVKGKVMLLSKRK